MTQAKRVLILGGGFAGLSALHTLSGQDLQITLVDQRNYHLFQPLLYQVATGELLGEVIATPFRRLGQGNNWRFHLGEVQRIDLSQRKVCLRNNEILPYDYLLLALGTATNFFGNESITNNALQIKGLEEAEIARSKIFQALENASNCPDPEQRKSWLRFVIAGGGAAGVEFCGALLETLRELLPREYPELHFSEIEIILVHGGEALLPGSRSRQYGRIGTTGCGLPNSRVGKPRCHCLDTLVAIASVSHHWYRKSLAHFAGLVQRLFSSQ